MKRWVPGISLSYYECLPRLLSKENERKIEPKDIPSCFIPRLLSLVVFTWQLEILVTTLWTLLLRTVCFCPWGKKFFKFSVNSTYVIQTHRQLIRTISL